MTMKFITKVCFIGGMLFCSANTFADGSNTISKGSAQVSQGSIVIGEGASQLFSAAATGSVNFVVDFIEVTGDVAEVVLVTASTAAIGSAVVTVSMTASAVASLAIAAGTVIDIVQVQAEGSAIVLGYLLMNKSQVLLFVSPDGSSLTLHSEKM
jgi:hypothetical protein